MAPSVGIGELAGDVGADPRTDGGTEREDGQRHRPLRRREVVGEEGARPGRATGFTDADADARDQQMPVVHGEAARGRHRRPDDDRDADDIAPAVAVDEPRQWEAEQHIEQRECRAGEERDAGVGELQFDADRLEQRGDNIAISDAECVDTHHHQQYIPSGPGSVARGLPSARSVLAVVAHRVPP